MLRFSIPLLCALLLGAHEPDRPAISARSQPLTMDSIPAQMLGVFTDDYSIRYQISDSLWIQYPSTRFHIIKWDIKRQYIVARNDPRNPSDPDLFTRIDLVELKDMPPYFWGFCLTVYNAPNETAAEAVASADRDNPRKGCNGFPFSRMKKSK